MMNLFATIAEMPEILKVSKFSNRLYVSVMTICKAIKGNKRKY